MITTRNLIVALFMLALLASSSFAKDDYVQYDLDKLAKKSEARLKQIDKIAEDARRKEPPAKNEAGRQAGERK